MLLNDGRGRLEPASELHLFEFEPRLTPLGVLLAGDLDGDGHLDLVGADVRAVVFLRGRGEGTFESPQIAFRSCTINSLVLADINQDDWSDVVAACCSPIAIPGGPQFALERTLELPGTSGCGEFLGVGDFDGDSIPDLIGWDGSESLPPAIRHGLGGGTFAPAVAISPGPLANAGRSPSIGQVADFDRDGEDEMALLHQTDEETSEILVVNRSGARSYEVQRSAMVAKAPGRRLLEADMDGDHWSDLVLLGSTDLTVLRNQATSEPTFANECTLPLLGPASSLTSGDIDGDGTVDLVINEAEIGANGGSGVEIVFSPLGLCGGGKPCRFEPGHRISVGPAEMLMTSDFTGDSGEELLAVRGGEGRLLRWEGVTVESLASYPIPPGISDISIADLDGDGRLDFATVNPRSNVVRLHLIGMNQALRETLDIEFTETPCAVEGADVNLDGRSRRVSVPFRADRRPARRRTRAILRRSGVRRRGAP